MPRMSALQPPNWQELTQDQQAAAAAAGPQRIVNSAPTATQAAMVMTPRRQSPHRQRRRVLADGDLPRGLTSELFEDMLQPGMALSGSVARLLDMVQGVEQQRARKERSVEVCAWCCRPAAGSRWQPLPSSCDATHGSSVLGPSAPTEHPAVPAHGWTVPA